MSSEARAAMYQADKAGGDALFEAEVRVKFTATVKVAMKASNSFEDAYELAPGMAKDFLRKAVDREKATGHWREGCDLTVHSAEVQEIRGLWKKPEPIRG